MRITEALHFYNSKKRPTNAWMNKNYSHFCPSEADEKARKALHVPKKRRRRIMQEYT